MESKMVLDGRAEDASFYFSNFGYGYRTECACYYVEGWKEEVLLYSSSLSSLPIMSFHSLACLWVPVLPDRQRRILIDFTWLGILPVTGLVTPLHAEM